MGTSVKTNKKTVLEWVIAAVLGGLAFGIVFVVFIVFFLPAYTKHGKEVVVPYIMGEYLNDARITVKKNNLRFKIVGTGDSVINVLPPPGSVVKPGKIIEIMVVSRNADH